MPQQRQSVKDLKELGELLRRAGARTAPSDTVLAHIEPEELRLLESRRGRKADIDPKTGLPHLWSDGSEGGPGGPSDDTSSGYSSGSEENAANSSGNENSGASNSGGDGGYEAPSGGWNPDQTDGSFGQPSAPDGGWSPGANENDEASNEQAAANASQAAANAAAAEAAGVDYFIGEPVYGSPFADAQDRSLDESLAAQAEAQAARDAMYGAGKTNTALDGTGIGPSGTNDHAAPGNTGEKGYTDTTITQMQQDMMSASQDSRDFWGKVAKGIGVVSTPLGAAVGIGSRIAHDIRDKGIVGADWMNDLPGSGGGQGKGAEPGSGNGGDGTDPAGGTFGGEGGDRGGSPNVTTPTQGGSGVTPTPTPATPGGTAAPLFDFSSLGGLQFWRDNYNTTRVPGTPAPGASQAPTSGGTQPPAPYMPGIRDMNNGKPVPQILRDLSRAPGPDWGRYNTEESEA